jgi:predicted RNA-binding protein YlxR (DUF448 family)
MIRALKAPFGPDAALATGVTRLRHVALRTCAGCGTRSPRAELARIGLAAGAERLEWRARGGRGTYLHDADECRRRFVAGKKRLPGLRAAVGRPARQALVDGKPLER